MKKCAALSRVRVSKAKRTGPAALKAIDGNQASVRAVPFRQEVGRMRNGTRSLHAVDPQPGNAAMQRIKHPPIRKKISLADPTQVRAWTRRLAISPDSLKAVIAKVGNSVA